MVLCALLWGDALVTIPQYVLLLDQYQTTFTGILTQLDAITTGGRLNPALMPQGMGELLATMRTTCVAIQDRLVAAHDAFSALRDA